MCFWFIFFSLLVIDIDGSIRMTMRAGRRGLKNLVTSDVPLACVLVYLSGGQKEVLPEFAGVAAAAAIALGRFCR